MVKMTHFPATIIIRHRKENLKKCSLQGLEGRKDIVFLSYPIDDPLPSFENYCFLTLEESPCLTEQDGELGLVLIDGSWRYAMQMIAQLRKINCPPIMRTLPSCLRTAYPRKQTDCVDPERGLASIEALYAAYYLLKRTTSGLLDHYYWKERFISQNEILKQKQLFIAN